MVWHQAKVRVTTWWQVATTGLANLNDDKEKNEKIKATNSSSFRRPFRACTRFYRSRCRFIKRVQPDAFATICLMWGITVCFSFSFGIQHAMYRYESFFDRNICYDGVSGEKPFSEHEGTYDMHARAQMVYEVNERLYKNDSKIGQTIEVFSNSLRGIPFRFCVLPAVRVRIKFNRFFLRYD